MNIIWKGSPNHSTQRSTIDRIVIHWFGAGTLESANSRFQVAANQVSAHYGISNGTVYQWVREVDTAYHAGDWNMNLRSIGIEHDAKPDQAATDETYRSSAQIVANVARKFNIPLDRTHVIGHKEVKATQCPGTMDLDRIIREAKAILTPPPSLPLELAKYSLEWKQIAIRLGKDVNSPQFADYRTLDTKISLMLTDATKALQSDKQRLADQQQASLLKIELMKTKAREIVNL